MCYHKLYIFTTCGHSFFGTKPLVMCRHASIAPMATYSRACELQAHPFQSLKFDNLCRECQRRRSILLDRLECHQIVRFDEWQWKVSYSAPHAAGLTSPSMQNTASTKRAEKEKESANEKKDKEKANREDKSRLSWKRSRPKKRSGGGDVGGGGGG